MTDFDLLTEDEARTVFGPEKYEEHVASGDLRIVQLDGEARVMGCDVKRVQKELDPRYMAKKVARFDGSRPAADPDDEDDPRNLARNVPRL